MEVGGASGEGLRQIGMLKQAQTPCDPSKVRTQSRPEGRFVDGLGSDHVQSRTGAAGEKTQRRGKLMWAHTRPDRRTNAL